MGRRAGYEYSYRFWADDNIIPLYNRCLCVIEPDKGFMLEFRTNFKLKGVLSLGSERFGVAAREGHDEESSLREQISFRLKDYWMSDDEIQSLVRDAVDFARRQRAAVIPVVVELEVFTVIEKEEDINDAVSRAITPRSLIPISVWPIVPYWMMEEARETEKAYRKRRGLLWDLPRVRIEDVAGLRLMNVCHVCWRTTIVGAQVSFIPYCNHACHSRCLFVWLSRRNSSCPSCFARIPTDSERLQSEFKSDSALSSDSDFDSVFEDDSFSRDSTEDDLLKRESDDSDFDDFMSTDSYSLSDSDYDSVFEDDDSTDSDFDDLMSTDSYSLSYPLVHNPDSSSESDWDSLACDRGVLPYNPEPNSDFLDSDLESDTDSLCSDSCSDTSTSSSDSGD